MELKTHSTALGPTQHTYCSAIWRQPILKRDALGLHTTLFYDNGSRRIQHQSGRITDVARMIKM